MSLNSPVSISGSPKTCPGFPVYRSRLILHSSRYFPYQGPKIDNTHRLQWEKKETGGTIDNCGLVPNWYFCLSKHACPLEYKPPPSNRNCATRCLVAQSVVAIGRLGRQYNAIIVYQIVHSSSYYTPQVLHAYFSVNVSCLMLCVFRKNC